jgi:hypothetical protein
MMFQLAQIVIHVQSVCNDMYKRHICSYIGSESLHDMYNSRYRKMAFSCLDVSSKKVHFFS